MDNSLKAASKSGHKYFTFLAMFYLLAIITSFTLSPRLMVIHWPYPEMELPMPGGLFVFPFIYFLADVITEVYGYAKARQVAWLSIFASLIYVIVTQLIIRTPTPSFWQHSESYNQVFNAVPYVFLGNFVGLLIGSFINDYLLSKLKIFFQGRYFWFRAVFSTAIGEAFVGIVGGTIAFFQTLGLSKELLIMIIAVYIFNLLYELVIMPFLYAAIIFLKRAEGIDKYDYNTDFNPFSLQEDDSV